MNLLVISIFIFILQFFWNSSEKQKLVQMFIMMGINLVFTFAYCLLNLVVSIVKILKKIKECWIKWALRKQIRVKEGMQKKYSQFVQEEEKDKNFTTMMGTEVRTYNQDEEVVLSK